MMDNFEMSEIFKFNNQRREKLLKEALKEKTPEKQIIFVANYFLNLLPIQTISQIDCVNEKDVCPFIYDYSNIDDFSTELIRKKSIRQYTIGRFGETLQQTDVDNRGNEQIQIYPTTYALKMATCRMFASEIQRFSYDFKLPCQIVETLIPCYDCFNGTSTTGEPIVSNKTALMLHYYNILNINGKNVKLDIAGALTANDYNQNNPNNQIDPTAFYFSEELDNHPFSKVHQSTQSLLGE